MKVEITKRFFFDEKEREKFTLWCMRRHLKISDIAEEFGVGQQYVYSILSGRLAITPLYAKKFYDLGYDLGEEINGTQRTRTENDYLCN